MKARKAIFVFGGIGIILILVAIRQGWFEKIKALTGSQDAAKTETASDAPAAKVDQPKPIRKSPSAETTDKKTSAEDQGSVAAPQQKQTRDDAVAAENVSEDATSGADTAAKAVPAVKKDNDDSGSGDPFAYAPPGSGDYTPLSGNKQVGTITVRGIICMAGEEPKAILHLKDSDRVHYVSKNSVVRVSVKGANGKNTTEAYIVVKDIRNDEVELIQLERPDKVIIIR